MGKLISYLITGILASSLLSSCEKDVEDQGNGRTESSWNIRNTGNDSINVVWYSNGGEIMESSFPANSDTEIKAYYGKKLSLVFDSISISCKSQMVTFVPIIVEDIEYPQTFSFPVDEAKSTKQSAYLCCSLSESSLSDIAKEMENHGQNVWRKK
ncbi:MAG: hypothetical protein K6E14_01820 [Paludibacteraceae bacterium]|nr:hypothetical protein [Paludibacteraceae bacterium]